jgi:hypothetical protein
MTEMTNLHEKKAIAFFSCKFVISVIFGWRIDGFVYQHHNPGNFVGCNLYRLVMGGNPE